MGGIFVEDKWIYLPEGGYPKNKTKVHVLVLSRCRDPYHDKGEPGRVYVTTAYFRQDDDGTRHWFDVILEDDMGYSFVNEYDSCEDFEPLDAEHPDGSFDSYIVAWQPMPEPPAHIVWPERKPMAHRTEKRKCPNCDYMPHEGADPNETKFCPRCGKELRTVYTAALGTGDKE